jgi:hypothetical protein
MLFSKISAKPSNSLCLISPSQEWVAIQLSRYPIIFTCAGEYCIDNTGSLGSSGSLRISVIESFVLVDLLHPQGEGLTLPGPAPKTSFVMLKYTRVVSTFYPALIPQKG